MKILAREIIKVNLIILIILLMLLSVPFISYATFDVDPDYLQQHGLDPANYKLKSGSGYNTELDNLEIQKSGIEKSVGESTSQMEMIEGELSNTVYEISSMSQRIYDLQLEIQTATEEEKQTAEYLKKAVVELEKSDERYKTQKDRLETRMVAMYEMGNTTYLDILLSSKGLSSFLSNWYLISEISKADNELLDQTMQERDYNKKLKTEIEKKKNLQSVNREKIEKNTIAIENMLVVKNNRMSELTEEEQEIQRQIDEYQKAINEIEAEIRLLSLATVGEDYVGGVMGWPVPGYTRITSPFGMRTHPITGVYKLHTGTDIGAPMGANFVAANDGVVSYAGKNAAYGNMVIINHGGGITTLYAHGSEILVQKGDVVRKGTPVLKVGSTGYSTGPHAHFEVRVNGQYVNPMSYITSY